MRRSRPPCSTRTEAVDGGQRRRVVRVGFGGLGAQRGGRRTEAASAALMRRMGGAVLRTALGSGSARGRPGSASKLATSGHLDGYQSPSARDDNTMWLTRFALKQPTIVTLFFAAIALFGTIGYFQMGKEHHPQRGAADRDRGGRISGASPEEIERLVIRPIEDQIQTVRHLDKVNATAVEARARSSCSSNSAPTSTPPPTT